MYSGTIPVEKQRVSNENTDVKALRLGEREARHGGASKTWFSSRYGWKEREIRTYNWKDSRCSDHRIQQNYPLSQFLNGDIDPIISAMIMKDQEEKLKELAEESTAM